MKNIVEMINGQIATGREVIGTQARMSVPFSPKATLTAIDDNGDFLFQENLPEDSPAEPRIWHINADNAELAHYVRNPNNKPCNEAIVNENGQLILTMKNGDEKPVFMGNIKLVPSSKAMSVPGKVFVLAVSEDDENRPDVWKKSNLYVYDVQDDEFHDCFEEIDGTPLYKKLTTEHSYKGKFDEYIIVKNHFDVISVKEDDGNVHFYRIYNGTNIVKFGPEGRVVDTKFIRTGIVTDIIPVEGFPYGMIVKVLPFTTLPDGTEVVDGMGAPKYVFDSDTTDEITVLDNGAELKAATRSHDILTVISDQNVKIFNLHDWEDNSTVDVITGEAATAIATHPYYAGSHNIYDKDGSASVILSYTDGESVVHVKHETSDRGDLFTVAL
jgi:hypothetical protein